MHPFHSMPWLLLKLYQPTMEQHTRQCQLFLFRVVEVVVVGEGINIKKIKIKFNEFELHVLLLENRHLQIVELSSCACTFAVLSNFSFAKLFLLLLLLLLLFLRFLRFHIQLFQQLIRRKLCRLFFFILRSIIVFWQTHSTAKLSSFFFG